MDWVVTGVTLDSTGDVNQVCSVYRAAVFKAARRKNTHQYIFMETNPAETRVLRLIPI